MKACVLHAVGELRCEEVAKPVPKPGEVLLRVAACGVCGSDIPRVFVKGTYRFPTIPGHEISGVVEACGEGVDASLIGKAFAVFPLIPCRKCPACAVGAYAQCEHYDYLGSRTDGGFAEYVCAPAWNLVAVPETVSMEEAAMTEPAAVAAHAVRQGGVDVGDAVAIYGAGPIGVMLAMWARAWGAGEILLIDIDPRRLDFAKEMGFPNVFDGRQGNPALWVGSVTGRGADLVIEGSGSTVAFEQCMHSARPFGRVVLMGNPTGEMKLSQDGYWAILRKELRVTGTWNSSYTELPKNEWKLALDFMAHGELNVDGLITHRVSLEGLLGGLNMMRDGSEFTNKVMYVAPKSDVNEGSSQVAG